ncbi:hypothetical protein ZOSMA_94G00300 [Zostera marina]|uniref:Symplekin n=1 Tax=Zostera marina TaxID=29655 RepID=A0A0K9NIB1_ZOSMR|nr:hypothetical protein ZOSMA_94G00300 [Zostera marina]
MDYEGRGRHLVSEGFGPSGRYLPDLPILVDLKGQVSPEYRDPARAIALLRKLDGNLTKESIGLMPVLVSFLNHEVADVVRQSIISGAGFICAVLQEITLQFRNSGLMERWIEDIWSWALKFKDAVCSILLRPDSVQIKELAVKFLEVFVLLFTVEVNDYERSFGEGNPQNLDISKFVGKHQIFDPTALLLEVKQCLDLLLDLLKSAASLRGSLTIVIINCLATIGRKRPVHFSTILASLLAFDPDFGISRGAHSASIRYSLKNAFSGFLRYMHHPSFVESRDKLLWALRTMSPGESTEQLIRQSDKISKSMERAARESRINKDNDLSSNQGGLGDSILKKHVHTFDDSDEKTLKRVRLNISNSVIAPDVDEDVMDIENGISPKSSLLDGNFNAVDQMIAMIGAMLAEGERGARSLEILISQIQPELLADIVMANMKYLPNAALFPLSSRLGNIPNASQTPSHVPVSVSLSSNAAGISISHSSEKCSQIVENSITTSVSLSTDASPTSNLTSDSRRDPRRDPRRLDPRRVVASGGADPLPSNIDKTLHSGFDSSVTSLTPKSEDTKVESSSSLVTSTLKIESCMSPELSIAPIIDSQISQESSILPDHIPEAGPLSDIQYSSHLTPSPVRINQDLDESIHSEGTANEDFDSDLPETTPSAFSSTASSEQTSQELPLIPDYIELSNDQIDLLKKNTILRIIEDYKPVNFTFIGTRLSLIARLVAQTNDTDELILIIQKHIIFNYHHQKGHDLALHILYHLYAIMTSELEESISYASVIYEKFLLAMAKSLHDSLPTSDKSLSRFLGEVPFLPDSAFKFLEDICHSSTNHHGKDDFDGDRVTQGLGIVWSLILLRPQTRQSCLNIALKYSIHPHDEVRTKAIRLVANKLYQLSYATEEIEQFAKSKLLSLIDDKVHDVILSPTDFNEQRTEVSNLDTCISGSQNSEPSFSGSDSTRSSQFNVSTSQAQQYTSLFFALCKKKEAYLQILFDVYGRAPKSVKQAIHRHIPLLIRNVGKLYSNLLRIISDPPAGSKNLLMLVLQILTVETTPSAELIATVKHLFETKLKDASVMIPLLSSLSKDEVLPIFPRLVDLPIEKFQTGLARILEGSAHTGPALSPAEVLIAIHNIDPKKDNVPLKKVMDACTACFEQRTVFTQHVLAKSLKDLVDQMPLPQLFMRTVIQAISAFPTLVDFVMEILSKLVVKQIWKTPKLWIGFIKLASQTQPHSFNVLLELPPPQLEYFLSKHGNLRASLSAHASQPSIRNSLPRSILAIFGITVNEQQSSSSSHTLLPSPSASSTPSTAALT